MMILDTFSDSWAAIQPEMMMLDKFITYQHGRYSQYSGLHFNINYIESCYSC